MWSTPVAQGAQDARGYMPGPPLTGMMYFPDLIELTRLLIYCLFIIHRSAINELLVTLQGDRFLNMGLWR